MIRSAFGMVTGFWRGQTGKWLDMGRCLLKADAVIPGRRGERPGGKQCVADGERVAVKEHRAGAERRGERLQV